MRELNVNEIQELNGGSVEAGAFATGAGVAAITGAALGPAGGWRSIGYLCRFIWNYLLSDERITNPFLRLALHPALS